MWANGPAGKQANARGRSVLYVFSFFDICLWHCVGDRDVVDSHPFASAFF